MRKVYRSFSTLTPTHRFVGQLNEAFRALGKDLVGVLRRIGNYRKDFLDVAERDLWMEEIAHGVDEDGARGAPGLGKGKYGGMKSEAEARSGGPFTTVALVFWLAHRLEPFGKAERVAVITARAHPVATGGGVPSGLCPLDRALVSHEWTSKRRQPGMR